MEELRKNDEGVNLLTLPRCDVGLSMPNFKAETKTDSTATEEETSSASKASYPSLLLLQLPPKWNAQALKDARFVIPNAQSSASLVVEDAHTSFCLQRVETSNALVLVPPPPPSQQQQQSKRRKVAEEGVALQVVQARLLSMGAGAFFLEPKTEACRLAELRAFLPIWDPTTNSTTTTATAVSMESLGNALAKSRAEVSTALRQLQAVRITSNTATTNDGHFCRVSEECRLDVLDAVLATLVEDYPLYAKQGIDVTEFVASARLRLPQVLQRDETVADTLVRYILCTLTTADDDAHVYDDNNNHNLRLHVPRVGAAVASRILTRQATWEESLLMARWQTEMPGVDTNVQTDWLAGHAIRLTETQATVKDKNGDDDKNSTSFHWKYLPAVAVVETNNAAVVWERLVHAQPEWTAQALKPYLDAWQAYTGQASATILRHAAVRHGEGGLNIYSAR